MWGAYRLFHDIKIYGRGRWVAGGTIIASNHASNYDPVLVGLGFYPRHLYYMAKEELFEIPGLKQLIEYYKAFPVSLNSHDLKSIRRTCELLDRGEKVLIFPEGQRTWNGELNPVKRGIGVLAVRAQANIIPCYVYGAFETWPRTRSFPRLFTPLRVVIGSPILWEEFAELPHKEAQAAVCSRVEAAIKGLKDWYEAGAKGDPP